MHSRLFDYNSIATLQPNLVPAKWGNLVNTHGGKGRNLPCDLHNEHVNRLYKQLIANMGALALVLQEQCPPLKGLPLVLRDRQASIQRQLITAGSQI